MDANNPSQSTSQQPDSIHTHDIGIKAVTYGWRRKCLYALILVLLFMVIVNLALTMWILKVMDFSSSGMGQLEIVPGGLRLKGNAYILDNLLASQIRTRTGEPIALESSRNITLHSRTEHGHPSSWIHLGLEVFECLSKRFQILDDRGQTIFSTDKKGVTIGADTLTVSGEGGTRFNEAIQTNLVRGDSGHELRLESPTRTLQLKASKEFRMESRGGNINSIAQSDIIFQSEVGSIRIHSSSVVMPLLPTAKVTNRPSVTQRAFEVFQLCACESGRLFLADPHVICASGSDDGLCR